MANTTGRVWILSDIEFTDTSAPILLTVDPVESVGSLALIEPQHPITQWASGVPTTGYNAPNLMKDFARSLGIASPETAAVIYNSGMVSPVGLVERSARGGLHGIVSKVNVPASRSGFKVELSDAIKSYILANPTHKFFSSVWRKVTRPGVSEAFTGVHNASAGTSNYLFLNDCSTDRPLSGAGTKYIGSRSINRNAVGNSLLNIGVDGFSGTTPASIATLLARACSWGNNPGVPGSATGHASDIFYRFYLEDLTVSGRTYAAVDALDNEQFEKHMMTAGGRYFGDTFTAPSTLP